MLQKHAFTNNSLCPTACYTHYCYRHIAHYSRLAIGTTYVMDMRKVKVGLREWQI